MFFVMLKRDKKPKDDSILKHEIELNREQIKSLLDSALKYQLLVTSSDRRSDSIRVEYRTKYIQTTKLSPYEIDPIFDAYSDSALYLFRTGKLIE
jgi:hypothetical protein